MNFIQQLQKRYACKAMNGKNIPESALNTILESIRLAPTSSGLQPFQVVVVTQKELKEKIKTASFNQSVVTDCSHLLVFAAWDTYTTDRINYMFDLTNTIRGGTNEGWENYRKQLISSFTSKTNEENFQHAAKQVYIALGFALAAAATEEVDSTPMEGFINDKVDEILNLREKGLKSVAMMTLGYSNPEKDWLRPLQKVRKSAADLFIKM
jgi:nitroreductase / dihydropteridine reductase